MRRLPLFAPPGIREWCGVMMAQLAENSNKGRHLNVSGLPKAVKAEQFLLNRRWKTLATAAPVNEYIV